MLNFKSYPGVVGRSFSPAPQFPTLRRPLFVIGLPLALEQLFIKILAAMVPVVLYVIELNRFQHIRLYELLNFI